MDISALAAELTGYLAPFLPYLLKMGDQVVEDAGKKLSSEGWEMAKTLWAKLGSRFNSKPAALEAAKDLVGRPHDQDFVGAFRSQLKKMLDDPALADELDKLVSGFRGSVINVTASGERAVAINEAKGTVTITTGETHASRDEGR